MDLSEADPKGLIRESYAIDGILASECRTIFLDWALSLGGEIDAREAMGMLIGHYGAGRADHPMTLTLTDGLQASAVARRKGGRAGRMAADDKTG